MSNVLIKNKSKKKTDRIINIFASSILIIVALLEIFPFYLSVVQSLQPKDFLTLNKIELWPQYLSFMNYLVALKESKLFSGFMWSLIYSVSFTLVTIVICLISAYIFEKKDFYGKKIVFGIFMSALMVPGEILLITNYLLITELELLKSPLAVIIPGLVNVFGIYLFKQFMSTIPDSLIESAKMDGASELAIIFKIIAPLCVPAIITYSIITFTAQWNEYLWPQLVLNDASKYYNVQLRLLLYRPIIDGNISHPYAYALRMCATMITLIPVLVFYFIFQKHYTEGITLTGHK